jgi:hypothetical protein
MMAIVPLPVYVILFGAGCVILALAAARALSLLRATEQQQVQNLCQKMLSDLVDAHKKYADLCNRYDAQCALLLEPPTPSHRSEAEALWRLLDDIDAIDYTFRNNHVKFRERVRAIQQRRHLLAAPNRNGGLTWIRKESVEAKAGVQ